jgi:hypothetical protein
MSRRAPRSRPLHRDHINDLVRDLKPDRDAKDALILRTLNELDAMFVERLEFAQHVAALGARARTRRRQGDPQRGRHPGYQCADPTLPPPIRQSHDRGTRRTRQGGVQMRTPSICTPPHPSARCAGSGLVLR